MLIGRRFNAHQWVPIGAHKCNPSMPSPLLAVIRRSPVSSHHHHGHRGGDDDDDQQQQQRRVSASL
jgi:hypothetical protein